MQKFTSILDLLVEERRLVQGYNALVESVALFSEIGETALAAEFEAKAYAKLKDIDNVISTIKDVMCLYN